MESTSAFVATSRRTTDRNWIMPTASSTRPWLIENPVDGSLLTSIPGGRVFTGGRAHFLGGCEPFWADVTEFYLALHPVTNAQYRRFVDATGHPPPRKASTGASHWSGQTFDPAIAEHPVVHVTWHDARAYCQWAGLRLPRELEWERAARGDRQRPYVWGETWDASLCQNDESRGRHTTCSIWSYPQGCSEQGCYQLAGNVWEWCDDVFDRNAYRRHARGDFHLPADGEKRVARGGSWFNVAADGFRCGYRFGLAAGDTDAHYGFRVARSIEVAKR